MIGFKIARYLRARYIQYTRWVRQNMVKLSSQRHLPISLYHRWRRSVITVNGIRMKVDSRISPLMVTVLRLGKHSMPERVMVLDLLEKDDVVLELGGGVGYTSICYAKKIGSGRVYTFEANPELNDLMKENFRLNNVAPIAESCMLGHTIGERTFVIAQNFRDSSNVDATIGRRVTVPLLSINDKIREIDPTFFVVDIEGGEQDLFDGLDFYNIKKIMLETHRSVIGDEETDRLLNMIESSGFERVQKEGKCYIFIKKLPETEQ